MCAASFVCVDTALSLAVSSCSYFHGSAALFGIGLSWRIRSTSNLDGFVTEVWQIAPNLDAISRPFLCSCHMLDWAWKRVLSARYFNFIFNSSVKTHSHSLANAACFMQFLVLWIVQRWYWTRKMLGNCWIIPVLRKTGSQNCWFGKYYNS